MLTRNGKHNMCNKFVVVVCVVFTVETARNINVFCHPFVAVISADRNELFALNAFERVNRVGIVTVINDCFCGEVCKFSE